jgi:tetratricopeptide (TPR) repeat protein
MNTPRTARVVAALVLLSGPVSAQKPRSTIDDASLAALQTWVEAVGSHTPGRPDASVTTVASFTYETREDLNTGINLFFAALMGWSYNTDNNRAAQAIAAMGHAAGKDFLKRAAVLHSDVAVHSDLHPRPATAAAKTPPRRTPELQIGRRPSPETFTLDDPPPPLLMADRVLLAKDGEVVGEVVSTWNWHFARSLLDLLGAGPRRKILSDGRPNPATDPFVSTWYHATAAYMFARGLYGDATPHLHHASMVLPDDALALFDQACYAEILGLPMLQALIPETDVGQRARGSSVPTWTTPRSEAAVRIPPASATNAEAERLFRRALAIDPTLVEARVRLARLLDWRGRHDEATSELNTALAQNPRGAVRFFAHLFGGRAAQSSGRIEEASVHYRDALELFPDAQSALLASSQIALLGSNVNAALESLRHLDARTADFQADPWWAYHLGAGRDADELLKALWAAVPR